LNSELLLMRAVVRRAAAKVRRTVDAAFLVGIVMAALVGGPRLVRGFRTAMFAPGNPNVIVNFAALVAIVAVAVTVAGVRRTMQARRIMPWQNPWLVLGGGKGVLRARDLAAVVLTALGWWGFALVLSWPVRGTLPGGAAMLALWLLGGASAGFIAWRTGELAFDFVRLRGRARSVNNVSMSNKR
jgi:hypothetical protein